MIPTQIIASVFALFMIYLTFLHYKREEFSSYQFFVWEALFVGFLLSVWLPDRLNGLMEQLGIIRAFDLFAIVGFAMILFLVFHNYLLLTKLERRLETKVRAKALDDAQLHND